MNREGLDRKISGITISRTIQYQFDRVTNIFHFIIDALNLVVGPRNFVVDALGEL